MILKFFTLMCLLIISVSCHTNTTLKNNQQFVATSTVNLPFFNKPDWTPEWIDKSDRNYYKIHTIPAFSFLDQEGKIISNKTVAGKIYVTNFFFTTCRGICPKMTDNMYHLQESFKMDSNIIFLSYTVSPTIDNVDVLHKYAIEHKVNYKQWHLLTGQKELIYSIARKQYFAGDTVGYYQSGNEFLHTENFILVDKHSRIRGVYNGTLLLEMERIKEDIAILKMEE